MSKLTDPYAHLPEEEKVKISTTISSEDAMLIRICRPLRGTLQSTINHMIRHLVERMRKENLDDYTDWTRFCELLHREFPVGGITNGGGTKTPLPDVQGGVKDVCPTSPREPDESANPRRDTSRRTRREKGESKESGT